MPYDFHDLLNCFDPAAPGARETYLCSELLNDMNSIVLTKPYCRLFHILDTILVRLEFTILLKSKQCRDEMFPTIFMRQLSELEKAWQKIGSKKYIRPVAPGAFCPASSRSSAPES